MDVAIEVLGSAGIVGMVTLVICVGKAYRWARTVSYPESLGVVIGDLMIVSWLIAFLVLIGAAVMWSVSLAHPIFVVLLTAVVMEIIFGLMLLWDLRTLRRYLEQAEA